jgi:hypothetical protein
MRGRSPGGVFQNPRRKQINVSVGGPPCPPILLYAAQKLSCRNVTQSERACCLIYAVLSCQVRGFSPQSLRDLSAPLMRAPPLPQPPAQILHLLRNQTGPGGLTRLHGPGSESSPMFTDLSARSCIDRRGRQKSPVSVYERRPPCVQHISQRKRGQHLSASTKSDGAVACRGAQGRPNRPEDTVT